MARRRGVPASHPIQDRDQGAHPAGVLGDPPPRLRSAEHPLLPAGRRLDRAVLRATEHRAAFVPPAGSHGTPRRRRAVPREAVRDHAGARGAGLRDLLRAARGQAGLTPPPLRAAGASSGIGQAYAERLARDGHDLIVIARRKDRLDALAKRLTADCSINVEVLAADLADPDQLATVEQHVTEAAALDPLVNNAGFGAYMPFAKLLPDRAAH
ncbi:MAG TPA: hypothetical protein DCK98_10620 [Chloroflexi bacterium]|nr:hypothetical protein [Chloroflexota bacterium]